MSRLENELLNYESKYTSDGKLKNKLNAKDEVTLNEMERNITTFKLAKLALSDQTIGFDVSYYLSIHKYIFGDIYEFAGEIRSENIAKRIPFCLPQYIYPMLEDTLKNAKKNVSQITDRDKLLYYVTRLHSDLDIIHPFREGNGRCEREFIRQYINHVCKTNNLEPYYLDYLAIKDSDKYIDAVVKADAFMDYNDLYILFDSVLINKNDKKQALNPNDESKRL